MKKLVYLITLCMIISILIAVSTVKNKVNAETDIQTHQPPQEKAVCEEIPYENNYFLLTSTGYYPGSECTAPYDDGYTAIGHVAGRGSIAIDPVNGPLKFNQRVYVEGYGHGICNDVGGAIKKWRIDLCFETLEEAKEWGVQLVKVYVIK